MCYSSYYIAIERSSQVIITIFIVNNIITITIKTEQHQLYFDANWGTNATTSAILNKRSRISPTPSKESVALASSSLEMRGLKKELGSINGSSNKYYDQFNGIPHALVGAAMIRLFVIDVMGKRFLS